MIKYPNKPALVRPGLRQTATRLTLVALAAASLAACRAEHSAPQVAGWTLIDPVERHPILVSQSPVSMTLRVNRGSYGLSNGSRERVARFLHKFRATDAGNSKLVISAPSGTSNEVAAMQVVAEVRGMISEAGFPPSSVHVEANGGSRHVRLSYLTVVAKGPECRNWPTNLAEQSDNLTHPNFGCSDQKNFAAMLANPADLLGPRSSTPRVGDRRDTQWDKYRKGQTTGARKSSEEKVSTQRSE